MQVGEVGDVGASPDEADSQRRARDDHRRFNLADAARHARGYTMVAVRPSWVFLDRDGTISERPAPHEYVTDPACVRLLPRAAEAVARLNRASIWVGVVTNQQGVALGSLTMETLEAVHSRLRELLAAEGAHLDGIWTCPHLAGECRCRKPQPGLLIAAKDRVPEIDFRRSAMIG